VNQCLTEVDKNQEGAPMFAWVVVNAGISTTILTLYLPVIGATTIFSRDINKTVD